MPWWVLEQLCAMNFLEDLPLIKFIYLSNALLS